MLARLFEKFDTEQIIAECAPQDHWGHGVGLRNAECKTFQKISEGAGGIEAA